MKKIAIWALLLLMSGLPGTQAAETVITTITERLPAEPLEGAISEMTTREIITADVDNDGRLKRIEILRKDLAVVDVDDGDLIKMEAEVRFDFDKAIIKKSAAAVLDKVSELIMLSGDRKVEVAGHADAIGGDKYNLERSWNLSQAVILWLVDVKGFPKARFRAIGRGEEGVVAPNRESDGDDNPAGRKLNRRVEILIRNQSSNHPEFPKIV